MPTMPRPRGKAKKIAFNILGVPANMKKQPESAKKDWIERRLTFEDTQRVR